MLVALLHSTGQVEKRFWMELSVGTASSLDSAMICTIPSPWRDHFEVLD